MSHHKFLKLQTPDEARDAWLERIESECSAPGPEFVPLAQSLRRVTAAPIAARRSSPAFHGAAMDGFAVLAEKTFTASTRKPLRLEINKDAFRINTGRPMPENTNAVVMIENVNIGDDGRFVTLEQAVFPWQHVRKAGEDMVETEIILAPGTSIGPYEIGALAAAGALEVEVFRQPLVCIIPSGSDLEKLEDCVEADLRSGRKLPEFNSLVFSALIGEAGGKPLVMPIVEDDPQAVAQAIENAAKAGADLIILNAGTSAGSRDFSAEVIDRMGEVTAHGVAMMPGKPTVLGLVPSAGKKIPIIGAPGYPVSAVLSLEKFVVPLLAAWQKRLPPQAETVEVHPCNPMPSKPGMEEHVRVKLGSVNGKTFAIPLPRGAGTVNSLSRADAIITIPAACEGLNADEKVRASLLKPWQQIEGALLAIGSHDNTLDLVDSMLRRKFPRFRLTSAHVGSLGGLLALGRGNCHLAGSHLLDPETGIYNQAAIRTHLKGRPVNLVRLVEREQGLIVAPGNPLGISNFADLARDDVRFINRQKGSGTRMLLDYQLAQAGISPTSIAGYKDEEYTHMTVASAVLSGRANVGMGVRAAANALGLEFIPLGMENYDLVIPGEFMEDERIRALLSVIRSDEFKKAALAMGGYGVENSGEIIWEHGVQQGMSS